MCEDIETYKLKVRQLVTQNRELRGALADEKVEHRADVKQLEAQLREGLSTELVALRREAAQWKERAQVTEQQLAEARRKGAPP